MFIEKETKKNEEKELYIVSCSFTPDDCNHLHKFPGLLLKRNRRSRRRGLLINVVVHVPVVVYPLCRDETAATGVKEERQEENKQIVLRTRKMASSKYLAIE